MTLAVKMAVTIIRKGVMIGRDGSWRSNCWTVSGLPVSTAVTDFVLAEPFCGTGGGPLLSDVLAAGVVDLDSAGFTMGLLVAVDLDFGLG